MYLTMEIVTKESHLHHFMRVYTLIPKGADIEEEGTDGVTGTIAQTGSIMYTPYDLVKMSYYTKDLINGIVKLV
jgi:hypothetical protein